MQEHSRTARHRRPVRVHAVCCARASSTYHCTMAAWHGYHRLLRASRCRQLGVGRCTCVRVEAMCGRCLTRAGTGRPTAAALHSCMVAPQPFGALYQFWWGGRGRRSSVQARDPRSTERRAPLKRRRVGSIGSGCALTGMHVFQKCQRPGKQTHKTHCAELSGERGGSHRPRAAC